MATMDEKRPATTPDADQAPNSEGSRAERRRRAQELLSTQFSQLDRLESELSEHVKILADDVAGGLSHRSSDPSAADHEPGLDALQSQLNQLNEQLVVLQAERDQARAQIEQTQVETGRLEQELRVREALLRETQSQQEQTRIECMTMVSQLADAQAHLSAAGDQQNELRRQLTDERESILSKAEETKAQRRRIARELKAQHAAHNAQYEQQKAELQALASASSTQLGTDLAAAQAEAKETRRQMADLAASLDQRSKELAQAQRKATESETKAAELREALDHARAATGPGGDDQEELTTLRGERDLLAQKLAEAEARLSDSSDAAAGDPANKSDQQRRFEMAVDELRELKRANADLEAKLAKVRTGGSAATGLGGALDWEAQKQQLLASLEADDRDDGESIAERDTIEGTIQITDQIVAQKDQEISELKRLLEEQSNDLNPTAVGAAAVADLLDTDELVRQEREKLAQVQAEWREKIGRAEIDISVERAKIARDRAELEDKMRQYQLDQVTRAQNDEPLDASKPVRGRWLARLGLKDLDDTP
jgi:chromosome segregation ATPase